ncbi:MAG: site-specific DNA-methyltransferase [Terriglobales bacterium]
MEKNQLYYGDNLIVLREYIKDESVDLIYLDPPFNSRQDYNVLFAEKDGTKSSSQIMAFEDTWEWNIDAERAYEEVVERGGRVADAMRAFRTFLSHSDMMAYLAMMAPRLIELHRVLKVTGSIYLHCDPTASHYLKMLMDAVFGPQYFRNEIIWKRTSGHSDAQRYGRVHDVILFFCNSDSPLWTDIYQDYEPSYVEQYYRYSDPDGRKWMSGDLGAAGLSGGGYDYEWKGIRRVWRVPEGTMQRLDSDGKVFYTRNGIPRIKRYLDESSGLPAQDVWNDVEALRSWHKEKLGYPTQKPEALLERILSASSNEGDVVLDPFCGCGTAISVAQRLNRRWIGIDITHLAIGLIKKRLDDAFGDSVRNTYEVIGEPVDLTGAQRLAQDDPYQFQWWALSLVGARPLEKKKGADQGIDGRLYFHDENKRDRKTKQIILSVKAGHLQAGYVRDLRGVIEREKAEIGVLISMEPPTKPMRKEAAEAGFYQPYMGEKYPRLQILSIPELLSGKKIDYPRMLDVTFKKAPKSRSAAEEQIPLGDAGIDDPF